MKRDDSVYRNHILDAISTIENYVADVTEARFLSESLLQDGVIRQLGIIGEAVKRLSHTLRSSHPKIPWQDVAGMRNKLIHDYFGVDLEQVWLTSQEDLSVLKAVVLEILAETPSSNHS